MTNTDKIFFTFCTIFLTFSVNYVATKSVSILFKRELNFDKATRCPQEPYRHFWTPDGCRLCTNCTKLGQYTLWGCREEHDAICEDRCFNKDSVFDVMTKTCRKVKRKQELAEKTTSGTVQHVQHETQLNSTDEVKTKVAKEKGNTFTQGMSMARNKRAVMRCPQEPYRHFWTQDGCRLCTNCTKLGQYTLWGCREEHDAICEDRCFDKDSVFDVVTKTCRKVKRKEEVTFAEKTTVGTVQQVQHETQLNSTVEVQELSSQGKVIIAVTVGGAVAAVTAICAVIWVKRRYLAKQKDQANVYQMIQINPNQNRPLPSLPPSSGSPSTNMTDSRAYVAVKYSQVATSLTTQV